MHKAQIKWVDSIITTERTHKNCAQLILKIWTSNVGRTQCLWSLNFGRCQHKTNTAMKMKRISYETTRKIIWAKLILISCLTQNRNSFMSMENVQMPVNEMHLKRDNFFFFLISSCEFSSEVRTLVRTWTELNIKGIIYLHKSVDERSTWGIRFN